MIHFLHQGVQVKRVMIESLDSVHGDVVLKQSPPLVETAPSGGPRILGIKRQQHDFVTAGGAQLLNRLRGERVPVAHGHKTVRVNAIAAEPLLQHPRLLLGKASNRRGPADYRIVVLYLLRACSGNQLGQRLASNPGKGKINNVGIAEKIKKKGFNSLRRVRAAELKENYSYSPCWVSHPPGVLAEGGCYSKSVGRVNEELRLTSDFEVRDSALSLICYQL